MSIKKLSRALLFGGLILIIYALSMDVSVDFGNERVFNLHKASRQSNMLMLGGFLFLAGIISMLMNRPKGESQSEEQEVGLSKDEIEIIKIKSQEAVKQSEKALDTLVHMIIPRGERWSRIGVRFLGGIVAGFLAATIFDLLAGLTLMERFYDNLRPVIYEYRILFELICFFTVLWKSLRCKEIEIFFRRIFGVELAAFCLFILMAFAMSHFGELNENLMGRLFFYAIHAALGFGIAAYATKKAQSKRQLQ